MAAVRLHLVDGRQLDEDIWCTGVMTDRHAWCTEDPLLVLWMGANHDVPCSGEPPDGCATPITLDADAVAQSKPLFVDEVDIPLTVGHHDVDLGRALLPNGFLDRASFALADPAPDGVFIPDGVRLEIVSTDPTRPEFGSVYDRGTFPGVEEVAAHLTFSVVDAPAGAVLQVRDVLVR